MRRSTESLVEFDDNTKACEARRSSANLFPISGSATWRAFERGHFGHSNGYDTNLCS